MSEMRVALIGYGLAGSVFHAPLIAATDGLRLASVVTSEASRQEQVRSAYPGAEVMGSVDELWERAEQELVVIATPNETHAPLALAAIDRGHAVVIDKPMALSAPEAEKVIERAHAQGVLLTTFQNRRWDSDHLTLRRLVSEGRLGEIYRYESRFERWRPSVRPGAWRESLPSERGGGQLLDLGSHVVDQAIQLFGSVKDIYAEVGCRRGQPADDDAFLALRHEGAVISHLHVSATSAAPGPRLRVLGSEAAYLVDGLDSQEEALRAGRHPDDREWAWGLEPPSNWGRLIAGEHSEPVPSDRGDWPRFYELLVGAMREGGPPPVDPWEVVDVLRVLDQARASG